MRALFTYLIFLSCLARSFCQDPNDVVRNSIDQFLNADNPNAALELLLTVEELVSDVPDSLKADYYISVGICYGQMGKVDSSFYFLDKAKESVEKSGSQLLKVKDLNTRGLVYMGLGDYEKSLTAYQAAMEIAEGSDDPKMLEALRKIYGNSGGIHFQLEQYEKAIVITRKALALSQNLEDKSGLAYNHLRLALVYNEINELDSGIHYLEASGKFFESLGDTTTLVYAKNTLGRVFEKKGDLDNALLQFKRANMLARSIGDQEEVAFTLISIASIHLRRNEISEAGRNAREALAFSLEKQFVNSVKSSYNLLYKCALRKKEYKKALEYRNQFMILSDSLNGVEVKERVAELETKYETAKKEAEIERLALENDLKDANLARARNAQYALSIGAGLTIILLIVFFTLTYKRQQAEKEAQELQLEAVKKRFMELHTSPAELAVNLNLEELNQKLHNPLTEREFDALKLTIEGKSNPEISEQLFISVNTVKYHLKNTYSKMGVGNRKEAFQYMLAVK